MPDVFLDSSILIYAAVGRNSDPEKFRIATQILSETPFRISAQVMAEFVNIVRRKAAIPLSPDELSVWLDELEEHVATPVDANLVRRGLSMATRYQLNYYDGAILAAAERLGCDTVLSEDMGDGQSYGSVTVRNPFKGG